MKEVDRSRILVVGESPVDPEPFRLRQLTLQPVMLSQLKDVIQTNAACGVLLSPFP